MRAVLCKAWDGPEGLVVEETEAPRPGPGEVALQVAAAGVNFANPPASMDDGISHLVVGVVAVLYSTDEIDPWNHRESSHHRSLAGDCQSILVVEC